MKPDFMDRAAKIIAKIRTRTYIDKIDTAVLEELVKDELNEYYDELQGYYDAGYDYSYDNGYDEGYALGYDDGYAAGHSESHSAV